MLHKKEAVLVLDDDVHKGMQLQGALEDIGYDVCFCPTILKAKNEIQVNEFDILCFDIRLDDDDHTVTSIPLAEEINKEKPLPTLFFTQYSDPRHELVDETRKLMPHSIWYSRKLEDWIDVVTGGITLAKELFRSHYPDEGRERIVTNRITFKEKGNGSNRVILHRDNILYIMSIEGGCEFHMTSGDTHLFGTGITNLKRQLERYRKYGWNFLQVDQGLLVNLDKVKLYDQSRYLYLENGSKPCKIDTTTTYINHSTFSDIFLHLSTEYKTERHS